MCCTFPPRVGSALGEVQGRGVSAQATGSTGSVHIGGRVSSRLRRAAPFGAIALTLALTAAAPAAANTPMPAEMPAAGVSVTPPTSGVGGLLGADHGAALAISRDAEQRRAGVEARAGHAGLRAGRARADRRRRRLQERRVSELLVAAGQPADRHVRARRRLLGRHLQPGRSAPARVPARRCPATTTVRARTSSRSRTAATSSPSTTNSARRRTHGPGGGRRLRALRRQQPGEPGQARRRGRRLRHVGELVCCNADAPARTSRSRTSTTPCSCGATTAGST